MATLEEIGNKVDGLVADVGRISASVTTLLRKFEHIEGSVPVLPPLKAYDLAPVPETQVVADGVTVNADGSVWTTWKGESPRNDLVDGQKIQTAFGYISPSKTPEIWATARQLLGPDQFAAWDAAWGQNPYGLYKVDLRPIIKSGVLNTVSFGYMTQPFATVVQ